MGYFWTAWQQCLAELVSTLLEQVQAGQEQGMAAAVTEAPSVLGGKGLIQNHTLAFTTVLPD